MDSIEAAQTEVFEEKVWIQAGESLLEGQLLYDPWAEHCETVLLLSPHPNFAGTMDNNVVRALAHTLSRAGYGVLRFNYPGVGASSINLVAGISAFDYWDRVEKEHRFAAALIPAEAAFDFLRQSLGQAVTTTHIVGYSFGGIIGLLLTRERPQIASVTAISMPWIDRYDYGFMGDTRGDKFFFTGDRDFACDQGVRNLVWPTIPEPKTFTQLADDHFFRHNETQLATMVLQQLMDSQKARSTSL